MEVEVVHKPTSASSPDEPPQSEACIECKNIFMQKETVSLLASEEGLQFKRSRLGMLQSGLDGCPLCRYLLLEWRGRLNFENRGDAEQDRGGEAAFIVPNEVLESWRDEVKDMNSLPDVAPIIEHYTVSGDVAKSMYVYAGTSSENLERRVSRVFKIATEHDDCTAEFVCGRAAARGVSKKSYQRIQLWLSDCDTNHGCRVQQSSGPRTRPTFVVDVSPELDAPLIVKLRLVGDEDLKYAALSYCWGQYQQSATSSLNLEAYLKGINSAILPKSLRDAIEVTRMLHLQYLWVDSLCILQDDEVAKVHEIARMEYIYSNAYVTISADSAQNCDIGFLKSDKLYPEPVTLPFCTPAGRIGSVELTNYDWSRELPQDMESHRSQPIHVRAWTFQESFMSHRMIAYSKHKIFWVCSQFDEYYGGNQSYESYSTSQPEGLPDGSHASDSTSVISVRKLKTPRLSDWYHIVEEYSWREMTEAADKLPALSSIASYFGRTLDDIYLAGIWKASFVQQLYWHTAPGAVLRRPSEWRAPSWSFMSIDGPISFDSFAILLPNYDLPKRQYAQYVDESTAPFCTVESVVVTPVSPNAPYGKVISGSLVMWCQPIKVNSIMSEFSTESTCYRGEVQMMVGGQKLVDLEFDTIDEGSPENTGEPASDILISTFWGNISLSDGLWCITLFCKIDIWGSYQPYGLVLAQLTNGNYHRVGTFRAYANYQQFKKEPRQKITIV